MSVYTGIDPLVIQARLTAAQTAYLDLCAGAQVVMVRSGDKHIQYTPSDRPALRQHIIELQAVLGQTTRVQGITIAGGKGL